jgi:pilus assembly protein CpaD
MTTNPSPIAGRRRLEISARILAAISVALMLAGCYTPTGTTASIPNDFRKRHPIALREGERTVEIFVGTNRGGLTPSQRADILAFARAWKLEATGGIIVDLPAGTSTEIAASDAVREIRAILTAGGVPPHGVDVRRYGPVENSKLAAIKLNYSKIVGEAGPCGLWPHDLGPAFDPTYGENRPYYNLGCSSQRNLAAMADNPADLVQPRGETPAYSARRSVVLDKYRKGEITSTTFTKTDAGKLSDVGK